MPIVFARMVFHLPKAIDLDERGAMLKVGKSLSKTFLVKTFLASSFFPGIAFHQPKADRFR